MLACILGFVGAVPVFLLLNHPSALLAQLGQLGLVAMIGLYGGAQPTIMVETAPLPVRCTAVALGYNISLGVIGGLTPLVATWLVNRTGDEIAPAFMIMAAAAVTFATLLWFRETYRTPVHRRQFRHGRRLRVTRRRGERAIGSCRQSRKAASGGVNLSFSASATARCVIMPS
jgi:MHS family proline/betaine transporter-like MFS transporter